MCRKSGDAGTQCDTLHLPYRISGVTRLQDSDGCTSKRDDGGTNYRNNLTVTKQKQRQEHEIR